MPASIILIATGHTFKGVGLALFCGLVVGSLDNILRPRLVGKDTKMPDLLIFLSTLGGIAFFGVMGFIIGPIIAALFVTIWEIYGTVFKDVLPEEEPEEPEKNQTEFEIPGEADTRLDPEEPEGENDG
jgi:predicted PurR-regulated permease PerM